MLQSFNYVDNTSLVGYLQIFIPRQISFFSWKFFQKYNPPLKEERICLCMYNGRSQE